MTEAEEKAEKYLMEVVKPQRIEVTVLTANREIKKAFVAGYREGEKMTDKEIQASDEEMEQFNVSQNEKCVSVKTEKLNDLMNKISFELKDANLQQGFEIICKRIAELEKENDDLKAEIGLNEATIQDQLEDRVKVIKENEDLKKNALVWHKVTCFDKPDENGCITNDNPSELGKQYLIRLKRGDFVIQELTEACDYGFVLEDYEWEDVDAWAELPEV